MTTPGIYDFEEIDDTLPFMPLAARRALDGLGRKLSLEGWLSLPVEERRKVAQAGAGERIDDAVAAVIEGASPAPTPIAPERDPDAAAPPDALVAALGADRPLDPARWRALLPLDRYVLAKVVAKPDKLARAYDAILGSGRAAGVVFTHLSRAGEARMVDVSDKRETARRAVASACVRTTREVVNAVASGGVVKGDVLAAARIAGILAAKRTPELVPLCHPVRTTHATVEFELQAARGELHVRATVEAVDRTGVEMEAMVAATVASLTVYDMIKSADRWATIDAVRLEAKSGGKSGDATRPAERAR
ncbi:MAG TPA: cyclic pyranopterin monophosphate synthase MoaC [Polyangiaceae bacterium]|jgi:cyclic pyranopterin phosphate synthase